MPDARHLSLRTVIAIADRMPELGAKFYQSGPARGISTLKAYLEGQVAAGVLAPHDCEVVAAQFIDACLSMTFKPMLFNAAGPPSDEQISRVVRTAVRTFLAAYKQDALRLSSRRFDALRALIAALRAPLPARR